MVPLCAVTAGGKAHAGDLGPRQSGGEGRLGGEAVCKGHRGRLGRHCQPWRGLSTLRVW